MTSDPAEPLDPWRVHAMLRRELLGEWTDRSLRRMVDTGAWVNPRHGVYAQKPEWDGLSDAGRHHVLTRAAVRQAKTAVVASHASAAILHGAPSWGLDLSEIHLSRTDGKCGRRQAGVRQHKGLVQPGDIAELNGILVMSPTRAALETTLVSTVEASLSVVNDLLHRGLTTVEAMRLRYGSGMLFWPDSLSTELVLRLADPRIESVAETRLLYRCYCAGLPAPTPQWRLVDPIDGSEYRLDFAWPQQRVWLEVDGKMKYTRFLRTGETVVDAVVREKTREARIAELTGWRCIRVTWADLQNPVLLARRIARALGVALPLGVRVRP